MASNFFSKLLSTDGFMPHGHCYQWEPVSFWISVGSDWLIALSYFSIAALLYVLVKRRTDIRFRGLFFLFAAFILLCGATHFVAMIGMWYPFYRFDALLKLATGLVSGFTAVVLASKMKAIQSIPTPTQYKKAQDDLRQESLEKIRAEEANRAKSVFLSNMSHELRTPLTSILCALDILASSKQSETEKEVTGIAQDSSNRLLHLINHVLDLSKAEAGKLSLAEEPFCASITVGGVCGMLRLQAENKGLEIRCLFDEASPTVLLGDAARLNQILINLIGNAVKFTETGHIEVRLHLEDAGPEKVWLLVEVEDTGVGIAEDRLDKVFEPFHQEASESAGAPSGGTGLGLTITREIVQLMEGTVTVRSTPGKGSCFNLRIPFQRADAAQAEDFLASGNREADLVLEAKAPETLRILLVEDNSASQQIIRKMLRMRGHTVRAAYTIVEARELFAADHGDVVLMDVRLGAESGLECTRILRAMESEGSRTPIIGLSAQSMNEDRKAALAAGMDEYLIKPVTARRLLETVERFGSQSSSQAD